MAKRIGDETIEESSLIVDGKSYDETVLTLLNTKQMEEFKQLWAKNWNPKLEPKFEIWRCHPTQSRPQKA